jgi:uncharacterized protein GlcG (DUF336 family)
MHDLPLVKARIIADAVLESARNRGLKPIAVVVLDDRGAVRTALAEDGGSVKRYEMAHGKANAAIALGLGTRAVFNYPEERRFFLAAAHAAIGPAVFFPGGVLIRDEAGTLLGAVGVSGDVSDNDEAAALDGIKAGGFVGDTGA